MIRALYVVIVMLFFISGASFADNPRLSKLDAEMIYADALNLLNEGAVNPAISKFKFLLENGYNDRYIYDSVLDAYASVFNYYQANNKLDSKEAIDAMKEAKKLAREAVKYYPTEIKILQKYVEILRGLGEYEAFRDTLDQILKIEPGDIVANYYLGVYYLYSKDYQRSTAYFQTAVAYPDGAQDYEYMAVYRSYYNLGLIAAGELNYQAAVQYFEKAKTMAKDNELLRTLALTYSEILEYVKAASVVREVPEGLRDIELVNAYAGALYMSGGSKDLSKVISEYSSDSKFIQSIEYLQKGDLSKALSAIDKHIEEKKVADFYSHALLYQIYNGQKDDVKASQQAFLLGNKAKAVGKLDLAIDYFRKVEKNTNSIPDIYWLIGSLYDDKDDITNAIKNYEKYLSYKGAEEYKVPATVRLSHMVQKSGNRKKAELLIEGVKKYAKTKYDLFQVYFYSGIIHLENKEVKKAIDDLRQAEKADNKDSRLYFFLGTAYFEDKDNKKAIEVLENARNLDQNSPELNNLLAYLYSLEKIKLDEGIKLIKLALITSKDNVAYLDTMGWLYFQQGDINKALEVFTQLLPLINNSTSETDFDEIYYHLGMVFDKMGDPVSAKKYFKKGLEINPKNNLIQEKLK